MKRMMTVLFIIGFVFSVSMLMAACAKKQIKTDEGVKPAAEAPAAKEEVGGQKVDDEAQKRAEAERLARLREQEMRAQREMEAFQSEKIYFDFDKSDLKQESQAILRKKADWLRANSQFSLRIEGHCDERGTNEYNLALGERRANAARSFLNSMGISPDRISTISYGEERPADPGHNDAAWAKNRRDEFKLNK